MTFPIPARPDYDPRRYGALCDQCSLQGRIVVQSEIRLGSVIDIVAEAPGQFEEVLGYPLVGPSGKEVEAALEEAGLKRKDVSLMNVMCCRAPEKHYEIHLRVLRAENRQRGAMGLPPFLPPHEACLPRLIYELQHSKGLLLIGKYARLALLGETKKGKESQRRCRSVATCEINGGDAIENEEERESEEEHIPARGFPGRAIVAGRSVPCLSTVHPAYVLRSRRWTIPFRSDVKKAVRMVRGELRWTEPTMTFFPSPRQVEEFLDSLKPTDVVSYDTETNGLQPTEAKLRCVAIGTKDRVICIPFRSVESSPRWSYSKEGKDRIRSALLKFFADPTGLICPQNGKYDYSVMEHCGEFPGFEIKRRVFDTVIAHHVAWSEWPHDLDFLIAQYTDAPHHKGKNHDRWESDRDLHYYCMLDVARTAECAEKLIQEQRLQAQPKVFKNDMWLSSFCRNLGDLGMKLNIGERDRLYGVQTQIMGEKEQSARKLALAILDMIGTATPGARKLAETLNPGSTQQVGALLYEAMGVKPAPEKQGGFTESGALSTSSGVLYFLMDRGLPDIVERFLLEIIDYRGAQKLRGTYCTTVPCKDGRVRPAWNPHTVVSGRLSCSKVEGCAPLMNLEHSIRTMYEAEDGHFFVTCDKAQLEARIMAILTGDKIWIDAFLAGADIHKVNAVSLLGIPSVEQVSKGHRQFTKTFVYAIQYGAALQKAYTMIRNFVDPKTGQRPYRNRTLSEISLCYNRFWSTHTAITAYHARNKDLWIKQGFLESEILGRRRYFMDGGGDESVDEELKNMKIQFTASDDVNGVTQKVEAEFPPGFGGKNTGIVHQCHDSLTLEVPGPWDNAVKIGGRVVELMYSELNGMPLPVDLAVSKNYGEKTEYVKTPSGEWVKKG